MIFGPSELPAIDAGFKFVASFVASFYVGGLLVSNFIEHNRIWSKIGLEKIMLKVAGGDETKLPYVALIAHTIMTYSVSTHGAVAMRAGEGKMAKGYDNRAPRSQTHEIIDAKAARALAANLNMTEGFGLFLTAIMVGTQLKAPLYHQFSFATTYAFFRVLYYAFYLENKDALRSISFLLGNTSAYMLIFSALLGSRFSGFYEGLTKFNVLNWPVLLASKVLGK